MSDDWRCLDAPGTTAPAVPAGWYPDPYGQPVQRYWDGRAWTGSILDPPPAAPAPVPRARLPLNPGYRTLARGLQAALGAVALGALATGVLGVLDVLSLPDAYFTEPVDPLDEGWIDPPSTAWTLALSAAYGLLTSPRWPS